MANNGRITIVWNGRKYRRYPGSKKRSTRVYFVRSRARTKDYPNGGVVYLHRDVWEYYNGPIPDGWHVHHIDGDTLNNDKDNLKAVPAAEHLSEHSRESWSALSEEERKRRLLRWQSNPNAKFAWTKTELGKTILRRNGHKTIEAIKPRELVCQYCGSHFIIKSLGVGRFCSNKCKSASRRQSGIDDRPRTCEVCHKTYVVGKYLKIRTCSRTCGQVLTREKNILKGRWKLEGAR